MTTPVRRNPWTRLIDNTLDTAVIFASVYVLWGLRTTAWVALVLTVYSSLSMGYSELRAEKKD